MNKFPGFEIPRANFSRLPHNFIEEVLPVVDTLAELKCIIYILRHTWGFSEYSRPKRITTDEFCNGRKKRDGSRFDTGTGLSEPSVRSGLEKAVEHGFLIVVVDDADKARVKKFYSLNMKETADELDADAEYDVENEGVKDLPPGEKDLLAASKGLTTVQRKKLRKEKINIPLSLENQIAAGLSITDTDVTRLEQVKQAVVQHFKLNVNWRQIRTRNQSFIPGDFLAYAFEQKITPEQIEKAAQVWREDKQFNWTHPSLKGIYEKWLLLMDAVEQSEPEQSYNFV